MTLQQIWQQGYDSIFLGSITIDDCPYTDIDRKRAWVLGFIAGLRDMWAEQDPL